MKTRELFTLQHTLASDYLQQFEYPWQALQGIRDLILELGAQLSVDYREIAPYVWVHDTARIWETAYLGSPCIIGASTEVRHGAFIRGGALVGEKCVIGNSVELKNAILFDRAQVPHYNYVGDSILGYKAHLGAGSLTSNVKSDKTLVTVQSAERTIETGLKKLGAMIGDDVEVGCNAVLNPGTIIGKNSRIYPLSCVRGVVPENCIYKNDGKIVKMR